MDDGMTEMTREIRSQMGQNSAVGKNGDGMGLGLEGSVVPGEGRKRRRKRSGKRWKRIGRWGNRS
jgi:hypothetical protein